MKCAKCHSTDIKITYKNSKDRDYENENIANLPAFTKYIDWQKQGYNSYYIQKEHLECVCKVCKHHWLEATKDS